MIDVRLEKRGVSEAWVKSLAAKTLKAEKSSMSLSILITGDREIRKINKKFLKHDYATDVISFPTGDIVASAETARRFSKELGISFREELARYLVHGTLHLLGYDDKKETDHRRMHARQEQILAEVLGRGPKGRR